MLRNLSGLLVNTRYIHTQKSILKDFSLSFFFQKNGIDINRCFTSKQRMKLITRSKEAYNAPSVQQPI